MEVLRQSRHFQLLYDTNTRTIISEWSGEVSYEDFEEGWNKVKTYLDANPRTNLVINFRGVEDISARARVWFEDEFIKSEGRMLLKRTNGWIIVRPVGVLPNMIVSNFIEVCKRNVSARAIKEAGTLNKALNILDTKKPKSAGLALLALVPKRVRLNWT